MAGTKTPPDLIQRSRVTMDEKSDPEGQAPRRADQAQRRRTSATSRPRPITSNTAAERQSGCACCRSARARATCARCTSCTRRRGRRRRHAPSSRCRPPSPRQHSRPGVSAGTRARRGGEAHERVGNHRRRRRERRRRDPRRAQGAGVPTVGVAAWDRTAETARRGEPKRPGPLRLGRQRRLRRKRGVAPAWYRSTRTTPTFSSSTASRWPPSTASRWPPPTPPASRRRRPSCCARRSSG